MERLATRFPRAHEENTPKVSERLTTKKNWIDYKEGIISIKVFVDTEEMENDTLEEIYGLCRSL